MSIAQPTLEAKVQALRQPASYPGGPAVDVIETHMSWVFLAGDTVWKLKKPVRNEWLDFSTPVARHFYCMEELRLNQALAGPVYLEVVALTVDAGGRFSLGGGGTVADWLVRMRRLPADSMLDRMLEEGRASADHLRWTGRRLCEFYREQEPAPLGPQHYRERLAASVGECETELCDPLFGLDAGAIRRLCAQLHSVLRERAGLFDARVEEGRIVEGHGDLRPEHIYLGAPPVIIDRLEFSVALRTLDPIDEVAFLALECERLGAPQLGAIALESYRECAGDDAGPALVHFYQSWRACIRASLAIRHLREPQYRDSPKWAQRTGHYLRLAAQHLQQCERALQSQF